MIKLIVAHDLNNLIGHDDKMPWHIKEELAFFKKETQNHALLMGKKTFLGINKVLPDRTIYVLTSDQNFKCDHDDVMVIHDAQKLIDRFKDSDDTLFIAGGRSVYEQFYLDADELIISTIKKEYEGNVYFIDIDYTKYELIEKRDFTDFIVEKYRKK